MDGSEYQLSDAIKQKALNELREDDLRKQQALEQFRDWITKQGHIHDCRMGMLLSKSYNRDFDRRKFWLVA